MKHSTLVVIPLLLIVAAFPANACGPNFPNDYLVLGGRDFARFPAGSFAHDLNRIMAASSGKEVERAITTDWSETLSADVEDVRQAITNVPIAEDEKVSITAEYGLFRQSMHDQGGAYREWASDMAQRKQFDANGWKQEDPAPERPGAFALAAYESLLNRLPLEFALYARSAASWHGGDSVGATVRQPGTGRRVALVPRRVYR